MSRALMRLRPSRRITSGVGPYEYLRPRNLDGSEITPPVGMYFSAWTGEMEGETVHDQLQTYPNVITLTDTGNVTTNATNLQSAMVTAAAASANTVITMPTGFEADGQFVPTTNSNGYWCSLQWNNASSLPTPSPELSDLKGTYLNRVTATHQAAFPKLYNTATLGTAAATLDFLHVKKWQLRGIDFTNPLQDFKYWLVNVGYTDINDINTYSEDIHFIQCACDGNWNSQRWIRATGSRISCTDGYSDKCGTDGSDPQNLYFAFGPGPFKFHNNYCMCRGASENIFSGSGGPLGAEFVIYNGQITQNYLTKPVTVPASAKYIGDNAHKNHVELKSGNQMVIQGNRMGYHNGGGQQRSIVVKLSEQNGNNIYAGTHDVAIMHNWTTEGPGGIIVTGIEFSPPGMLSNVYNIFVANNLCTPDRLDVAPFACWEVSTFNLNNIAAIYNTFVEAPGRSYGGAMGLLITGGQTNNVRTDYNVLIPNMTPGSEGPTLIPGDTVPGNPQGDALFAAVFLGTSSSFVSNLSFDAYHPEYYPAQFCVSTQAALGIHDFAAKEMWLDAGSPGYQAAPDGRDVGYQKSLFDTIQARVLPT